ncbi:hypothetical protein EDD22DRAFT_844907 [Suillus occidentalis]|nr:hypothetical protein EDD22DRAFT_844907 [Suillus occidentalis]
MVLEYLLKDKTIEDEKDAPSWQWLQQLVGTLEEGGMSSKESNMENNIKIVLHGSKPMKWMWSARNLTTSRAEVDGLSEVLYNKKWLAVHICQRHGLPVKEIKTRMVKN